MNIKSKVEMEDRREKPEKMTNWEWFWKKDLGGGGGGNEQNISRIARNPLSVSAIRAPLLKNPKIAGKTVIFIIISKQNNRHKQKKGRSPKKKNKEHNNNPDTNNRETRSPQMQETWVWKGDAMELALKESNKLKKGRKKKEDRTESKRKQNVRSKGFDELPRGSRTAATNNDYSSVVLQF